MSDANVMRVQEARIEGELARLRKLIERHSTASDALPLAVQLTRLVGAWRRVLVARERLVYRPRLASLDGSEALMAGTCREQMKAVAERVELHAQRWSSSAVIASDFAFFRDQSTALMVAIETHFECDRSLLGDGGPRRIAA